MLDLVGRAEAEHPFDLRRRRRQIPAGEQRQWQSTGNGDHPVKRHVSVGEGQHDRHRRDRADEASRTEIVGMDEREHRHGERPERALGDRAGQQRITGTGEKADARHAVPQCREQGELHEQKPANDGRVRTRSARQPQEHPKNGAAEPNPSQPGPGAVLQHRQRAGAYQREIREQRQGARRIALHEQWHGKGADKA